MTTDYLPSTEFVLEGSFWNYGTILYWPDRKEACVEQDDEHTRQKQSMMV